MEKKASQKPHVLVVDDSEFTLSQLTKALESDFEVTTARDGSEGLVCLDEQEFALVVTDLLMPKISGLAFLGMVRQRFPDTPVIVCSADVQDFTSRKARRLGAASFLNKPVDAAEVLKTAKSVINTPTGVSEEVSPRFIDAFKEIFNIGVGRAAKALSKLVYEDVRLSVPNLEIMTPEQLAAHVKKTFKDNVACVRQGFSGAMDGSAYLLLDERSGISLVNALIHEGEEAPTTLSDSDKGLLVEVGNILINSLVGTLANALNVDLEILQAVCKLGSSAVIHDEVSFKGTEYILLLETLFVVPGRHIGGNLIIAMGSASMGTLMQGIEELL